MQHGKQVADGVVIVLFEVRPHGVAVIGLWEVGAERVILRGLLGGGKSASALPEMFSAGGAEEAVSGVIGVIGRGIDALILEENNILNVRIVAGAGDVASRIVSVTEILHHSLISGEGGRASSENADQALVEGID